MKILMPKIGMSMQDGTIVKWHVTDGDMIKEGDPLMDIQTEKLVTTVNATATGVFMKLVEEGNVVVCGGEVAEIK